MRELFGGWIHLSCALYTLLGVASASSAAADGGVTFDDLAAGGGNGLVYQRSPSPRQAIFDQIAQQPAITIQDFALLPMKPRGAPGVALFDHDGDGDLDIYVANGPGTANSLFSNQRVETGQTTFVDLAGAAGVEAVDQDSQGVCFGDLDNDGDHDLLVVGNGPNRLFENQGDGTFADVTASSGVAGDRVSTGCSLGDINGDGLLDVAIANSYQDWNNQFPYLVDPFAFNQHNQLYLNEGGNVFTDASAAAGIEDHAGLEPGTALLTWAVALVDVDQDGDLDFLTADDQTVLRPAQTGGLDVGFIRLFRNDGTGRFTDVTFEVGLDRFGAWMGLSFADFNCDGHLDIFGTNMGDYALTVFALLGSFQPGDWASRWFLGQEDGTFADPGVGPLVATPFGWGTSAPDYDNDGDADIVFHGGFSLFNIVEASNPGVILQNQGCGAEFSFDATALAGSTNHGRRTVQGVAAGDLDDDGFVDIVSVSNFDAPPPIPQLPFTVPQGSVFDATASFIPVFVPISLTEFMWTGVQFPNGSLSVELNSGSNGNGWIAVDLLGTTGITTGGSVNRDGIGAVVSLSTDEQPNAALQPALGGSSYASQDALRHHFGLGDESRATIDVLWPGGVRNRLRRVRSGERVLFPEIPCSFEEQFVDRPAYVGCVNQALDELIAAGVLQPRDRGRFFSSAFACEGGSDALCLRNRRFQLEVDWRDFQGNTGTGRAVSLSDGSGFFYFFDPDIVELHAKVIDGCSFNGHHWLFAAASTDVEYTLRVTDTQDGTVRTYSNVLGERAPAITDTRAFATCP